MKYAVEDLVFADTELENERLEFLDTLNRNHNWLRREAEQVLGCKIRSVKPVGAITDPDHFDEGVDICVAFKIQFTDNIDVDLSNKLQEHFANLPLENVGIITAIVYN